MSVETVDVAVDGAGEYLSLLESESEDEFIIADPRTSSMSGNPLE